MNTEANQRQILEPDVLNIENINIEERPTLADWKLVQGGMPEIVPVMPEKGFYHIIHRYINTNDYNGTGAIVPTSVPLIENWAVKRIRMIMPDKRRVQFPTALLWKYHGKGCEARSGIRYERVKVSSDK